MSAWHPLGLGQEAAIQDLVHETFVDSIQWRFAMIDKSDANDSDW